MGEGVENRQDGDEAEVDLWSQGQRGKLQKGAMMGYLSHETTFDFGVDGEVFEDMRFIDIFLSILDIVGDTFLLCSSRGHLDLIFVEYAAPGIENTLEKWGINIFYTPPDIPPQITPKTCNCSLGNESLLWGGNIHGENQPASQPAW